ncbi:MAG: hypothetical protein A2857_03340 [Candidatus Levybacteria bacterium RIFCSPHIGHO2_01_FULL_36_15]|nr:MAG: hypothetical protein A2857_03340 [Candidatus Levybacteria bacterium RIFCSPHIGHO2_01_FULL_36_15]OGH38646.1 MAG: hypothetical protein A2905_06200 [Candidatus Levybacteria bacterium RIFCSPLOWO2_01_FULL_36_10]
MIVVNIFISSLLGISFLIYCFVWPKKKFNFLAALILISLLPVISILRKGSYESGHLALHVNYTIEFYENLIAGNIFPQWADIGYGFPIHIFQYPLPYYAASIFHFIGFSFLNSVKLVLFFTYILSGITMYLWIKEEFGKIPGFVSAILYLFAPAHLVDMHFVVSLGESAVFAFIPLAFFSTKKFIETGKTVFFVLLSISVASLILTHPMVTIIIFYFLIVYALIIWFLKKKRKVKLIVYYFISILFGLMLSIFYWLPLISEEKYTMYTLTLPIPGFLTIKELLYSPALFGLLFQGNQGKSYNLIGYAHLILLFISIFFYLKKIFNTHEKIILLFFLGSFSILILLMLPISKPIWKLIPYINNIQSVARLLVPISFVTSAIAGIVVGKINKKWLIVLICIFTIYTTILNWGNRKMVPENRDIYVGYGEMYTEYYERDNPFYQKNYNFDGYILKRPSGKNIEIVTGKANLLEINRNPTKHEYIMQVKEATTFKENTFYFPGWTLMVNNKLHKINYQNLNNLGIITFDLNPGLYKTELIFNNTPVRSFSQSISIFTFILLTLCTIFTARQSVLISAKRFIKRTQLNVEKLSIKL